MAARLPVEVLWRGSAGHTNGLRLGERSCLSLSSHRRPSTSRITCFSSQGSPILRNNASPSTSTALDTIQSSSSSSSNGGIAMLEPYVQYIDQLPQLLHLPPSAHSYAISVAILTVVVRSCITLPISLWQRARMKRMEEFVAPRWEQIKKDLPVIVAKRSRREKKSYEEYEKELKKELKLQIRALTKKYNCSPSLSIAVPLMVHLPLFLTFTLLLRTSLLIFGSPISLETIPWWAPPAELQEKFNANAMILAERGLEGETLKMLTTMQGPTLSEIDKTMLGPIGLGILTMTNVELGQWVRRGMKSEKEIKEKQDEKMKAKEQAANNNLRRRGNNKKSSSSSLTPEPVEIQLSPMQRTNVFGNSLRALAIGFVAVSSQAPTGVVIYWLTSTGYTLAQNFVFALIDRRRMGARKKKVVVQQQ